MLDGLKFWRWFVRGSRLEEALLTCRALAEDNSKMEEELREQRLTMTQATRRILELESLLAKERDHTRGRLGEVNARALHYAEELGVVTGKLQAAEATIAAYRPYLDVLSIRTGQKMLIGAMEARSRIRQEEEERTTLAERLFPTGDIPVLLPDADPAVYDEERERPFCPIPVLSEEQRKRIRALCKRCRCRGITEGKDHCTWCRWIVLSARHMARDQIGKPDREARLETPPKFEGRDQYPDKA